MKTTRWRLYFSIHFCNTLFLGVWFQTKNNFKAVVYPSKKQTNKQLVCPPVPALFPTAWKVKLPGKEETLEREEFVTVLVIFILSM